jgi:hypothetical protein|eukprot:g6976.t1
MAVRNSESSRVVVSDSSEENHRAWDYGLHNMCLIQAVRTGAMEDCVAALEENAILEWLTPGYYKILGETDDSDLDETEAEHQQRTLMLSEGFPGYERDYMASNGNTALHIAARQGNKRMMSLLLKHKWGVNVKNGRNQSPMELAELVFQDESADYLRAHLRRKRLSRCLFKVAVQLRRGLNRVRAKRAAAAAQKDTALKRKRVNTSTKRGKQQKRAKYVNIKSEVCTSGRRKSLRLKTPPSEYSKLRNPTKNKKRNNCQPQATSKNQRMKANSENITPVDTEGRRRSSRLKALNF